MLQSGVLKLPEGYAPECYSATIKHISLKEQKSPEERFKRSVKYYTQEEYDEFIERNLQTFQRVYDICVLGVQPQWNTDNCIGKYGSDCTFKSLHELSPSSRDAVKQSFYQISPAWDTYVRL
jgi:hypothetical protein